MSLCDACPKPGSCCRMFTLSVSFWDDIPIEEQWAPLAEKYPFVPAQRDPKYAFTLDHESGRMYSPWQFNCPKLGADGRCTIYEDRPMTCRTFQPASDPLCVLYKGPSLKDGAAIAPNIP